MRIVFSAGEQSGDVLAGELAKRILASVPSADISGVGSKGLLAAGGRLIADSSSWGAIGLVQSLRVLPHAFAGRERLKRHLASGPPGLFIPIDFGYMNIHVAKFAKARGWKVLYASPPGSWRKDRQGADLPMCTDAIVTPFAWSAEILNRMGGVAHWFGHPIKELVAARGGLSGSREGIAILPGSRLGEVECLAPILAESVQGLDMPCEVAVASNIKPEWLQTKWRNVAFNPELYIGDTFGVLSRAMAGLVCSGTATLEAALCHCPQVAVYRVGLSVLIEARILGVRPKYISQPNIILDREVVPELIQEKAKPENIRRYLEPLLTDGPERAAQLNAYDEISELLGPSNAITRTAELAIEMASG